MKRKYSGGSYAPNKRRLVRTAVRLARRAYRSYTRSNNKSANPTPAISQYHENRTMYRKRRMPKGKRRRWVSFKKKVQAVSLGAGKKLVLYHKDAIDYTTVADQQASGDISIFTGWNQGFAGGYDLLRCNQLANNSLDVAASVTDALLVKQATLNITFFNAGTAPAYIDLYWYRAKRDCVNTPYGLFREGLQPSTLTSGKPTGVNEPITAFTGASALSVPENFGAVPFMSRPFCQHNTITKVTKHLIAPSTSIEFQIKDRRNRLFKNTIEQQNNSFTLMKNITKGVVPVVYGVPSAAVGGAGQYAGPATIYCRREVTYQFYPVNVGSKEQIVNY